MQYFTLLISQERDLTPDEGAAEMAAYQSFHTMAAAAIRGGDALLPAATGARVTGGPDAPVITDGPFAEGAEVAGGYYLLEADNLDDALALARNIPAARHGAVELWPTVHSLEEAQAPQPDQWIALLLEPTTSNHTPGTPEWDAMAARHGDFAAAAGGHLISGAALHDRSTATTVRVRDDEVLITDGPYVEGAEVATGFYVLSAADRDEATKIAAMIPASTVLVRKLAGISGL